MNHGAEAHTTDVHGRISVFLNKKNKKHESTFTTLKHAPSDEQNLTYNLETLHHTRAVKSPTVVIFEDTKHIVVDSLTQGWSNVHFIDWFLMILHKNKWF